MGDLPPKNMYLQLIGFKKRNTGVDFPYLALGVDFEKRKNALHSYLKKICQCPALIRNEVAAAHVGMFLNAALAPFENRIAMQTAAATYQSRKYVVVETCV